MLRISFDFNETSKSVTNVKVTELDGKSRGISASSIPIVENSNTPDLEVLENKLQLSKSALQKLDAKADNRLSIQYVNDGIGKAFPVVGKAEMFTDRLDGNRITAKGTVAFRGEKRTTLLEFGSVFNFEEYKDGIWKMIPAEPSTEDSLLEETSDAEALNDAEIEKEIEEITSSVADDDLPF